MAEQKFVEGKQSWSESSLWSLIAANVITIILAVYYGWNFKTLILIYWFQSIIIGFFNFLRILNLKKFHTKNMRTKTGQPIPETTATKIGMAFFFVFHFGIFHLVYFIFLAASAFISQFTGDTVGFGNPGFIFLSVLIFLVNHLFSFRKNLKRDAEKTQSLAKVMLFPYARIIPMHFVIVFGFFLAGGKAAIIAFLLLKTVADVIMHAVEHR